MANLILNPLTSRLKLFVHDFSNESVEMKKYFDKLVEEKNGDWEAIRTKLVEDSTPELVAKLDFTNKLANWTGESEPVVRLFQKDKNTNSMRDIALRFNKANLTKAFLKLKDLPGEGDSAEAKAAVVAKDLHNKLFHMETCGVLLNMISDVKLSPVDPKFRQGVATVLTKIPEFNIRTTSVYTVLQDPKLLEDVAEDLRQGVMSELKRLQRVQAISPVPEVVPVLMNANMTSAFRVTEIPEKTFEQNFSASFGEGKAGENIAMQVYHQATNNRIRVEQGLIAMREAVQGTGIDFIDKGAMISGKPKIATDNSVTRSDINAVVTANQKVVKGSKLQSKEYSSQKIVKDNLSLTWEVLLSSVDFCECGECNSVYSAAAYCLELLQYLRNNSLDPENPRKIHRAPMNR